MIPLIWFLFAWLFAMAVFALITFLTVLMNLRFAPATFTTYFTTIVFLATIVVVFFLTIPPLVTVDWSQSVSILGGFTPKLP